jgi:uncharacterized RDD family membrane protein YckC
MNTTPPLSQSAEPAGLMLRVFALLYDALPVLGLWFAATVAALAITGGGLDVHRLADKALMQALLLAATAGYFVISWRRGGQTIGMKPWRLRIVRSDGNAPGAGQLLLRFIVAVVSLCALGTGFLWALFDAQSRTWHDIAAGTVMVRMAREQTPDHRPPR